jgi:Spy/CpxP family protein refolding chaperone
MRARLPWILLAVSVALNIFFLAGAFWVRVHHGPHGEPGGDPEHRIAAITKELSLDAKQREALERFVRSARQGGRQLREKNEPVLEQSWRELSKDNPDDAAIERAFSEATANRRAYQLEVSRSMRQFLATLSPDQREKFLSTLRERQRSRGARPWP